MPKAVKKTVAAKKSTPKEKTVTKKENENEVPETVVMINDVFEEKVAEASEHQEVITEEGIYPKAEDINYVTLKLNTYNEILEGINKMNISIDNFNNVIADMVKEAMGEINEKLGEINKRLDEVNKTIAEEKQDEALALLQQHMNRLQEIENETNIEIEEVKKEVENNVHTENNRVFISNTQSWNGIKTT